MRIPCWLAAAVALGVLVTPSVGLAQGADSPTAAVERFVKAVQDRDQDLLTEVGPPDNNGVHDILLKALTIHEATVTGAQPWLDGTHIVTTTWKAAFDFEAFLEIVAEGARQSGIPADQIKEQIEKARGNAEFREQVMSQFSGSSMDFTVEETEDGSFRVHQFDPTPDRGDEDPEQLIERFVAAWAAKDADALQALFARPDPASLSGPLAWAFIAPLLLATTPSDIEVIEAELHTGHGQVVLGATVAVDEEKLAALSIEHSRRYMAEVEGRTPEEIDEAIEEDRERFLTDELPELVERSKLPWRELTVIRHGSRWMIETFRPLDLHAPLRAQIVNVMACAMDAIAARNLDRAIAMTPPSERGPMSDAMRLVLAAVTLGEYQLGDIEIDGDTATVRMSLSLDYDVDGHMEVAKELYRETLSDAGQPAEGFEQAWNAAKDGFRDEAERVKELMENADAADLVRIDGCWYISRFRVAD